MLIPTSKNTRNITDFRKNPDSILEAVQGKSDPIYLFRGSEPRAVVLDIEEYARQRELIEDYMDTLSVREYLQNPEKDGVSFDEFLKELNITIPGRKINKSKTKKNVRNNN